MAIAHNKQHPQKARVFVGTIGVKQHGGRMPPKKQKQETKTHPAVISFTIHKK